MRLPLSFQSELLLSRIAFRIFLGCAVLLYPFKISLSLKGFCFIRSLCDGSFFHIAVISATLHYKAAFFGEQEILRLKFLPSFYSELIIFFLPFSVYVLELIFRRLWVLKPPNASFFSYIA